MSFSGKTQMDGLTSIRMIRSKEKAAVAAAAFLGDSLFFQRIEDLRDRSM